GTGSGGPDFAYDLCARRIAPEERAGLDLRSWSAAFDGAEPVRGETLAQFLDAFAPCGFRREAFVPCYGLAEASLLVACAHGWRPAPGPVSCGMPVPGIQLRIVEPEARRERLEGEEGEIWVAGPSVGLGYWRRPEETRETFGARLPGSGDGPFLRT